ncbi:N-acetylmuramoyl-L-alanine amidase [Halomonas denitrificans]|nr:N-acetylmuramoyl-L-alanine amidase [Halomonas denitrificans]
MPRVLIIALLLTWMAAPAGAGEVENVRVWAGPDKTRVVLDLDAQVDYRLFTLDAPHRLVVDIDAARMSATPALDPEHSGVVEGVRHGVRNGNDLRVVLDLADAARTKSFLLEPTGQYGHRLVLDLYPHGAESATDRLRQVAQTLPADNRDMLVAIDAGHGGEDPGAIGPGGTYEKHVVMAIARELARQVDAAPGMSAVLIRTGDYYIPLKERYQRAREARADLMLSIHADAFRDRRVRGSKVFVLSRRGASSEAARLLAESENAADRAGGVSLDQGDDMLRSVLLDLSQSASMEYSNGAAQAILDELVRDGKTSARRTVERANFVVLRSHDVPSVLIETGFISNPDEEKNLGSPRYRAEIASAILRGVEEHFRLTAPRGTWFAANRDTSEYIVQRGDTLGTIAQRYSVSLSQLRRANRLDGDVIHPGAVLVIPPG